MDIFDAAERYKGENRQVIILAGKEYGCGSSRDWAAKGPWILVGIILFIYKAEPQSSFDNTQDLRTGGPSFHPCLGQYSFGGLMIAIATGLIPLLPLSIVSTMVMCERSQ